MNERYKQIAQQALDMFNEEHMYAMVIVPDELREKFAELIVRECASIVEDAVNHREPASTYVDKIKKHFGVEE